MSGLNTRRTTDLDQFGLVFNDYDSNIEPNKYKKIKKIYSPALSLRTRRKKPALKHAVKHCYREWKFTNSNGNSWDAGMPWNYVQKMKLTSITVFLHTLTCLDAQMLMIVMQNGMTLKICSLPTEKLR